MANLLERHGKIMYDKSPLRKDAEITKIYYDDVIEYS